MGDDARRPCADEQNMKLKVPDSSLGQLLFFFTLQFIAYFMFVANTRAFTQANYGWTWITDTWLAAQSFAISKLMIDQKEGRGLWAGIGYTLGGPIGSLLSIYLTKRLYGH